MNVQQRDKLFEKIETIRKFDLDKIAVRAFSNSEDITKEKIGGYTVAEFKQTLYRVIDQLEAELKTQEFIHLPPNVNNVLGQNINLDNHLEHIASNLRSNNLEAIKSHLMALITYQKAYGFWSKSVAKLHDVDAVKLKEAEAEIGTLKAKLEQQIEETNRVKQELEKQRKELGSLTRNKRQELDQITNELQNAQTQSKSINQLLQQSQQEKGKIEEIASTQNKLLDDLRKRTEEEKKTFNTFSEDSTELKQKLEKTVHASEEKFTQFEAHYNFINSKKEEIEKLTGMAADGALGNRFFKRQESLKGNLELWKWFILIAVIATGGWVFIVFDRLATTDFSEWINLIINVIKTLPAFVLAGFVIRQYVKERNLQEEYAYRAAVAMTLTAYSEMLKEGDDTKNNSRQQMLLDSISRLYTSPRIHKPSEDRILTLSTKDLRGAVNDLTAVVKEVKNEILLKK
ncbi:MAG: hypothetical protein RIC19_00580 [Phaeodactylibacter sp.]|uniref:hypothetical protein n=1 Tax=Phaeodactylibacter sp. TaxID=1940289 RepID=UPI0032EB64A5